MADVKVLKRGGVYITPAKHSHIDMIERHLSPESVEELAILGYEVRDAMEVMLETSQSFAIMKDDGTFLGVAGLQHFGDHPQMFGMFSNAVKDNYVALARGSRMLLQMFEAQEETIVMAILSKHEAMVQWAAWLGFNVSGVYEDNGHEYVQFVRCRCPSCCVATESRRPAMH